MKTDFEDAERDIVGQQAAQWLCILAEGNPSQRAAFVRWLKKSPHNVEEFLLISAVCKGLGRAEPADTAGIERLIADALNGPVPANVIALPTTGNERQTLAQTATSQRLEVATQTELPAPRHKRIDSGINQNPRTHATRRVVHWAGIAAGIGLLVLGAIWATPWVSSHLNTYATAVGEQRTVRLEDGSVVYMNAQSRFTVNYSTHARDIDLIDGEAIFKVEHTPNRPFRVHTHSATIQAVGTQFNVYRRARGSTVVSVLEGAVRISKETPAAPAPKGTDSQLTAKPIATLRLTAGEEASVMTGGPIVKRTRVDLSRTTAWRERRLVFREDRLEDIAAEFGRYSPRRLVLSDEITRNKRITGTFDADDPQSLVLFLENLGEFAVETTSDDFIVRQR